VACFEGRARVDPFDGSDSLPGVLEPPVTRSEAISPEAEDSCIHQYRFGQRLSRLGKPGSRRRAPGPPACLMHRQDGADRRRLVSRVGCSVRGWGLTGGPRYSSVLAFLFTPVDFLGHDASHQQTFASRQANQLVGSSPLCAASLSLPFSEALRALPGLRLRPSKRSVPECHVVSHEDSLLGCYGQALSYLSLAGAG
jgi:hypothetical protein